MKPKKAELVKTKSRMVVTRPGEWGNCGDVKGHKLATGRRKSSRYLTHRIMIIITNTVLLQSCQETRP